MKTIHLIILLAVLLFSVKTNSIAKTELPQEGKPMVVALYNENCRISCKLVKPMLKNLSAKYGTQVEFHELNLTKKNPTKSIEKAKKLGVESFVMASASYIPCVGIFNSQKVLVKEIPAKKPKKIYEKYIDKALADRS